MLADEQLNQVLAHMSHDAFELYRALTLQQQAVGQLVVQTLAPGGAAAVAAAAAAVDRAAGEVDAVGRLPLLRLIVPEAAAGAGREAAQEAGEGGAANPVLRRPTLGRLQLAAQQLLISGRVTTGGKAAAAAAAAGDKRPAAKRARRGGGASQAAA